MSDADNMRKYLGIITESQDTEKEVINEAKPMGFWKQLMAKANITDAGRSARVETGKIANEEYKEWKQYLGSLHKSATQGTVGDAKKFFTDRGFPAKAINSVIGKYAKAKPGTNANNIVLNNPQTSAKMFLDVVIATRQIIGYEGGQSALASRVPQDQQEPAQQAAAPQAAQAPAAAPAAAAPAQTQTQAAATQLQTMDQIKDAIKRLPDSPEKDQLLIDISKMQ